MKTPKEQGVILNQIQETNELVFTLDEVEALNTLLEKAQIFYPRNVEDKRAQSLLITRIKKLQKLITNYISSIDKVFMSENEPSTKTIDLLKSQFLVIDDLYEQVNKEHYRLQLKYD